ncbi:MAG TPA: STAS domain-containing protein [Candidatus Xenobia bacterium]|nr:STAS domain-containing protein [Candidatus Xenobia bacterium]
MPLEIKTREVDGVMLLELNGKIILGDESSSLRETIKGLLGQGKKKILLNLARISFIDSTGVGTLVAAYTSARSQGGEVKLSSLTKKFRETLQVTRLLTVFEVFDDDQAALASFKL